MKPCLALLLLCLGVPAAAADGDAAAQVRATEQAFADTMAARDFDAFQAFLDPEAVFFAGPRALRGKAAVAAAWSSYFASPEPPFSWRPAIVEVLDSGDLALSSGPVFAPGGDCVGTFTSIWRRTAEGAWRIIFDKGSPACEPPPPEPPPDP